MPHILSLADCDVVTVGASHIEVEWSEVMRKGGRGGRGEEGGGNESGMLQQTPIHAHPAPYWIAAGFDNTFNLSQ